MGYLVKLHPEEKLVLQHGHVPLTIHGNFGGQKVQWAPAAIAAKAAPDHDICGVLDIHDRVPLLVAAGGAGSPDLLGPGVYKQNIDSSLNITAS